MGYVFTEILPWILLALVVGFLLGLFFWWCRWWLAGARRHEDELERVHGLVAQQERRARDLAGKLDAREVEFATLTARLRTAEADGAALTGEIDGLRSTLAGREAEKGDLAIRLDEARSEKDRLQARVADLEPLQAEKDRLQARVTELEALQAEKDRLQARVVDLEPLQADKDRLLARVAELEPLQAEKDRLLARVAELEAGKAPAALGPTALVPPPDVVAGAAVLGHPLDLDDLTVVEGIGPKIAGLLHDAGVTTWRALSTAEAAALRRILDAAGPRFQIHDPQTWPRQAGLLADGRWGEFKALTESLRGGRPG